MCHAIRDEFGTKIIREKNADKPNKVICDAELKRFRDEVIPALDSVRQIAPLGYEAINQSREVAALCLSGISTDFTWADNFITSHELREEALKLAEGTLATIRIEDGLAQIRDSARQQRTFGKPVSSAPSLTTYNGFGFTLYGGSDFDAETNSYAMTYYFVALFIPIFPISRYRVIRTGSQSYRFIGKLPLRDKDRWHLAIAVLAIIGAILLGSLSGNQNSSTYRPSSSRPPSSSVSVPSVTSRSSQLSAIKSRIDADREQITALETKLQPIMTQLEQLNAQMKTIDAELNDLDAQQRAGQQININAYNAEVNIHNAILSKYQALMAANSSDIQLHDDLLKQDGALVEQYNALLK